MTSYSLPISLPMKNQKQTSIFEHEWIGSQDSSPPRPFYNSQPAHQILLSISGTDIRRWACYITQEFIINIVIQKNLKQKVINVSNLKP